MRTEIETLDRLSTLLDTRYRIPGTPIRLGWDTILGLFPGIGDLGALAPSGYLNDKAYRLGACKRTLGRMSLNTRMDFVIGALPVLGDVFDLVFKANNRNFTLLRDDIGARLPDDRPITADISQRLNRL